MTTFRSWARRAPLIGGLRPTRADHRFSTTTEDANGAYKSGRFGGGSPKNLPFKTARTGYMVLL